MSPLQPAPVPPWGSVDAWPEDTQPAGSDADLIVAGAGAAGLTAAATAAEAGADVVMLVPPAIADATAALPGWLTALQAESPHEIRLLHGEPAVRAWAAQTDRAIAYATAHEPPQPRNTETQPFGAEPDLRPFGATTVDGYWAFQLRFMARALRIGGYRCTFTDVSGVPFPVRPELVVDGGAVVDPARWLTAATRRAAQAGVRLVRGELTGLRVERGTATVTAGATTIRAPHVILATARPLADRALLRPRLRAETWHLAAIRTATPPDRELQLIDRPLMTLSRYDDLVVVGQCGADPAALTAWLRANLPDAEITHRWSTTTYRSIDGLPLVGPASLSGSTVLTATGLGGWPLVRGIAAGLQLADAALGRTQIDDLPWHPRRVPTVNGLSKRGRSALAGATPWVTRLNVPGRRRPG